MSQFGGVERPGPWEIIGNHEQRIRSLEATPAAGGSGIQFETSPQEGEWLIVTTTDGSNSPSGQYGILLDDYSPGSATSVLIRSQTGEIDINAGDQLGLACVSGLVLTVGGALFGTIDNGIDLTVLNTIDWDVDGDFVIRFDANAESFSIFNASNVRTFRFRADGSIWNVAGLPTANPGGTNNIWNNGGVLNIT